MSLALSDPSSQGTLRVAKDPKCFPVDSADRLVCAVEQAGLNRRWAHL